MSAPIYAALVHHPVRDRDGGVMTSAITNVDVHDIARSCRTYGLAGYFVVSPIAAQRELVEKILEHWRTGAGARRVPERSKALALCRPTESIDAALAAIEATDGAPAELVITEARPMGRPTKTYAEARAHLEASSRPAMILFGTAHGLHADVIARADVLIEPIDGPTDYNHLSVRAAAAITFDRLRAPRR